MSGVLKRLLAVCACAAGVCGVFGCQSRQKAVEVVISGGACFAETLAGRWVADGKTGWEFVFEPDGSISSAVISMGRLDMVPGEVREFPTKFGGRGIFEPGVWTVRYDAEGRELAVEMVIEHFYQDMGKNALEGEFTDTLVGPLSEDGGVWKADWFRSERLIGHTPEPKVFSEVSADEARFIRSLTLRKVVKR